MWDSRKCVIEKNRTTGTVIKYTNLAGALMGSSISLNALE